MTSEGVGVGSGVSVGINSRWKNKKVDNNIEEQEIVINNTGTSMGKARIAGVARNSTKHFLVNSKLHRKSVDKFGNSITSFIRLQES